MQRGVRGTVTKAEGSRKGLIREVELGQSFVERVGVGICSRQLPLHGPRCRGGTVPSVFWKQRPVGWNMGLHVEVVENSVREVG